MKVLVTGATGFFGGNLVRVLHARGHDVRYLARGGKTAIAAKDLPNATPIAGEFWFSAKGTSDDDGFVRIPLAGLPRQQFHMQVVRHPDHAVTTQSLDPNPI